MFYFCTVLLSINSAEKNREETTKGQSHVPLNTQKVQGCLSTGLQMKGFFFFLLLFFFFFRFPEPGEKSNLDRKFRSNENWCVWEKLILVAGPFNIRVCPVPCVLFNNPVRLLGADIF